MNGLTALSSLGLELPSPQYIVGAILFSIAGYAVFRRGRKAPRSELTWAGVGLMVYPYAVAQLKFLNIYVGRVLDCNYFQRISSMESGSSPK